MNERNSLSGLKRWLGPLILSCALFACGERTDTQKDLPRTDPESQSTSTPPLDARIAITKIDEAILTPDSRPDVGMRVVVEGTITNPELTISVLVHPIISDTWWVQNPPSLPEEIGQNLWGWRTTIFCGNEVDGRREQYEILALAESKMAIGGSGTQIMATQLPEKVRGLPRSKQILVKRVRD